MERGLFITVEGVEGSGKSTQLSRLAHAIRVSGRSVIETKEPGGTQTGDRIRSILLDPQEDGLDGWAEAFLHAASRRQHVVEILEPALERGAVVCCDRYVDATFAYQGFGRLLDLDRLRELTRWATDGLLPDVTFLFDLPEQTGLERARSRNETRGLQGESRIEGEDLRFHRRVREGYLALAEAAPERFVTIDASGAVDEVTDRLFEAWNARFPALAVTGDRR